MLPFIFVIPFPKFILFSFLIVDLRHTSPDILREEYEPRSRLLLNGFQPITSYYPT